MSRLERRHETTWIDRRPAHGPGGRRIRLGLADAPLSWWPGAINVQRGGESNDRLNHPDGSLAVVDQASYSISDLEIPLLLRYRPLPADRHAPVLITGPVWRVALSSGVTWDGVETVDWADGSDLAFAIWVGMESVVGRAVGSIGVIDSRSSGEVDDDGDRAYGASLEGVGVRWEVSPAAPEDPVPTAGLRALRVVTR